MKKFHAVKGTFLTETHMEMRISFCNSFLRWNHQYQMAIRWSDESTFKVEELFKHQPRTNYSKKNQFARKKIIPRKKAINVWAAIRGDGKVIFELIDGEQKSEKYIQIILNKFPEMDFKNSFFMQDGAGIHTSSDAIEWLDFLWKDRWIGLKSTRLVFPPYSVDLTPMDF